MKLLEKVPSSRASTSALGRKTRLDVESLEARLVPYAVSGNAWPHPQLVTLSFVPDGTNLGGVSSNLFAAFNAKWATATWQNQILRAAQVWAQQANLNFAIVADSGAPIGSGNYEQGDPTMGDIRIGGYNLGSNALAAAYLPPPANNYSIAGDLQFNTAQPFNIGGTYDLFTVAAHEIGHTLGMSHSGSSYAVMYANYTGKKTALNNDDIAGIQSIYGARQADRFDAAASNGSFATATNLSSAIDPTSLTAEVNGLDVTTTSDADYYTFTAPQGAGGQLTVTAQSKGLSLLAPTLTVYAADQKTVLGSASGASQYGTTLTVNVGNVTAGEQFYVKVAGADVSAFGTGAYALSLNFGSNASPTATPPNTQTAASSSPNASGGVPNTGNDVYGVLGTVNSLLGGLVELLTIGGPDAAPTAPIAQAAPRPATPPRPTGDGAHLAQALAGFTSNSPGATGALPFTTPNGTGALVLISPATAIPLAWANSAIPTGGHETSGADQQPAATGSEASRVGPTVSPETSATLFDEGFGNLFEGQPESPSITTGATDHPEMHATPGWQGSSESEASPAGLGMAVLLGGGLLKRASARQRQFWKPTRAENRRAPRRRCLLRSYCRPIGAPLEDRWPAVAENLSTGGVRLLLPGPLPPDAVVAVELESANQKVFRWLLARVTHVRQQAPGEWSVGCAFDCKLSDGDLHALQADE